jgi:hypothetical protein
VSHDIEDAVEVIRVGTVHEVGVTSVHQNHK